MQTKEFLQHMTTLSGGSGYEEQVSRFIKQEFEAYCEEVTTDAHYMVTGIKSGNIPENSPCRILICAHMDEITLLVKEIDEQGFLRVAKNGGFDIRLFPGLEVLIHGKREIPGVFGAKPPHIQKAGEKDKPLPLDDLYIDTGLTPEHARELISIGDIITYNSPLLELKNDCIAGKAMDDRAGLAILLATMRELEKLRYSAKVYFGATVQEEIGVKGATMIGQRVQPDIGIAIDVTHAVTPDAPASSGTVPLSKGISITCGPNIHPGLFEKLCKTAQENRIEYSVEVNPRPTGTDARALQIAGAGMPTLLLSIPLKYMHTPCEVIRTETIDTAGKLLALFIAEMKGDWKQWIRY